MSRSYKKTPVVKDNFGGKTGKRLANKKVRKLKNELFKGGEYKKVYESWDINDYISYYTLEEAIKDWLKEEQPDVSSTSHYLHNKYGSLERWIQAWKKMMVGK